MNANSSTENFNENRKQLLIKWRFVSQSKKYYCIGFFTHRTAFANIGLLFLVVVFHCILHSIVKFNCTLFIIFVFSPLFLYCSDNEPQTQARNITFHRKFPRIKWKNTYWVIHKALPGKQDFIYVRRYQDDETESIGIYNSFFNIEYLLVDTWNKENILWNDDSLSTFHGKMLR